jgi:F0F1-type ATP synthase membrane subunit b/b'
MKTIFNLSLFSYLVIIFLLSKELFVFNAEFLVAITFFLFIFVATKYLSANIANSLDSRAKEIKQEFDSFVSLRLKSLDNLIAFYNKNAEISNQIKNLADFSTQQVDNIINSRELMLNLYITQQINDRLQSFQSEELNISEYTQAAVINYLFNNWSTNPYSSKFDDSNNTLKSFLSSNYLNYNSSTQMNVSPDQVKTLDFLNGLSRLKLLAIDDKKSVSSSNVQKNLASTAIVYNTVK